MLLGRGKLATYSTSWAHAHALGRLKHPVDVEALHSERSEWIGVDGF